MATRGFYRLAKADIPRLPDGSFPDPEDYGTRVLRVGSTYVYLHSETFPNRRIEALGAEGIGGTWKDAWQALPTSIRDRVFRARVRRLVDLGDVSVLREMAVQRADILIGDEVLQDRLPHHKWAGDSDPVSVEED